MISDEEAIEAMRRHNHISYQVEFYFLRGLGHKSMGAF
jgi:hypothetical protein